VGGLYCVALGRAVFGESMFAHARDASKIALAALVCLCRREGVALIDCQQNTAHLASLGAREIPRADFLHHIASAQTLAPLRWHFDTRYWDEVLTHAPAPPTSSAAPPATSATTTASPLPSHA
jgi:leucyl/phenylalanyl-tRNA--protein transferase